VTLALDAAWLAQLRSRIDRPPLKARVPLWAGDARIGSVEPQFLGLLSLPAGLVGECMRAAEPGWEIVGDVTTGLHAVAQAMRTAGVAHVWRNEQLAVMDEQGRMLGTVERAAVRPLGITTYAVHLAGHSPDGRHWVQQRSLSKANDPGLWDTLTGGMVPAHDSLERALERETWEEAGLALSQVQALQYGGRIATRRPSGDVASGYVVEYIDWYRCTVPDGAVPVNQDGEVERFALLDAHELGAKLHRDEFTLEAAIVLSECARVPPATQG
jgi:8-oxo-dGTP pyrophosphatase MutT (NUDIX family)